MSIPYTHIRLTEKATEFIGKKYGVQVGGVYPIEAYDPTDEEHSVMILGEGHIHLWLENGEYEFVPLEDGALPQDDEEIQLALHTDKHGVFIYRLPLDPKHDKNKQILRLVTEATDQSNSQLSFMDNTNQAVAMPTYLIVQARATIEKK